MATMEFHDLDDVKMLVEMLQGEWQDNHGKASTENKASSE